jgi:hypothetical protein
MHLTCQPGGWTHRLATIFATELGGTRRTWPAQKGAPYPLSPNFSALLATSKRGQGCGFPNCKTVYTSSILVVASNKINSLVAEPQIAKIRVSVSSVKDQRRDLDNLLTRFRDQLANRSQSQGQRMWLDLLVASGLGLPALVYGSVLLVNYMQ